MSTRRQILNVGILAVLPTSGCLMYGKKEWVPLTIRNEDLTEHTVKISASTRSETYKTTEDVQSSASTTVSEFIPYSDNDYRATFTAHIDGNRIVQEDLLVDLGVSKFEAIVTDTNSIEIRSVER